MYVCMYVCPLGPSINDVTHIVGGGVHTFVTMCDEGEGVFEKCDVTSKLATLNKSST